jgi:NAD(P)-dependent dehydrogenase (short-subunit alcohol dehydrogenase family)
VDRTGQRALIIGGSSGIGLGVARLLDTEGARVVIASREQPRIDRALSELGKSASGVTIDVTDEDSVARTLEHVGAIDHLIYTAGASLDLMPVNSLRLDAAKNYYDVRCFGILLAVKHAHVREGGCIVLTSGIAGARPSAGWAVASGTAGTIEAFTRALAVELAPLRVNAVSPGTVRTDLWADLPANVREDYYQRTARSNLTNTISEPDEIAPAYAALIDQPFATGSILVIDGGRTLV